MVAGASIALTGEGYATSEGSLPIPDFRADAVLHLDDSSISLGAIESPSSARFGEKDSWRWFVQAGFAHEFNDESEHYLLGVGLSYFMTDDLSIDLELNGFYVHQEVDDAFVSNFNVLLRWHFLARESWSLYADAGAGLSYATDDVPENGSHFNFTPQGGVGFSVDVGHGARLLTGVRWHHMSNARTRRSNPGRDAAMIYAQLSFPF